jgi:hypothetical protein
VQFGNEVHSGRKRRPNNRLALDSGFSTPHHVCTGLYQALMLPLLKRQPWVKCASLMRNLQVPPWPDCKEAPTMRTTP